MFFPTSSRSYQIASWMLNYETNRNVAFLKEKEKQLVKNRMKEKWKKKWKYEYEYGSTGCEVFKWGVQNVNGFCLKIDILKGNYWILRIGLVGRCQKLDIILVSKVI